MSEALNNNSKWCSHPYVFRMGRLVDKCSVDALLSLSDDVLISLSNVITVALLPRGLQIEFEKLSDENGPYIAVWVIDAAKAASEATQ